MNAKKVLNGTHWQTLRPSLLEGIRLRKTMALLLLLAASTMAAFAQGKVSLQLDVGSAITLLPCQGCAVPGDLGLLGQPVPTTGPLPSGQIIAVGLYGGTSSTSLSLQGSTILNPVGGTGQPPGVILKHNIILTGIPGAVGPAFFQVRLWDATFATYEAFAAAIAQGGRICYGAENSIFTMTPGTSISFPSIISGGGTTWTVVGNESPLMLQCFSLSCDPYAYITGQPTYQTVVRGGIATFQVVAHNGCASLPLSYQWRFNGAPIPGANNSSYQITNVQATNAGHYAVYVASYYSVLSSTATLTVLSVPPTIISPPQSQTAEVGATVGFRVGAVGDPPLVYKWFLNATNAIGGATTNSVLQLTDVQFSQAGSYTVVVTNVTAAVTSAPAMLNVITPVERRPVPALTLMGESGDWLNLDYASVLIPAPNWAGLDNVALTNAAQWYFDAAAPLASERFYRAYGTNVLSPPSRLGLHFVPALTLTGAIGSSLRLDYINQFGPVDAWVTLATVTLTNTTQLYFDTSVIGQPPRLWRIVLVP